MGDLIRTPYSEVTSTLELLDRLGVTPHDFEVLRKSSSWSQEIVGRVCKTDSFLWAMLEMEQGAKKVGFLESDFRALTQDEEKLRQVLAFLRVGGSLVQYIVEPPEGGKIHIVLVQVDESRPWDQAVRAAGPDTSYNYAVWRVGDKYPPQQFKGDREVILVNFGRPVSSGNALAWGKEYKLHPASPRTCFSVAKHIPNLHTDLGLEHMAVLSLAMCSFGGYQLVCSVWWDGLEREVGLSWFGTGWHGHYWFAFVRE